MIIQKLKKILKSILRIFVMLLLIISSLAIIYFCWSPGMEIKDGRYNLHKNGIWIQHGWLGDDKWFKKTGRDKNSFRNIEKIKALSSQLTKHNILFVYPHLCPTQPDGKIPDIDDLQTKLFLQEMKDFAILPWVGGIKEQHCFLDSAKWRKNFIDSILAMLNKYPGFAGIHINIEPMPSGDQNYIELLKEIKRSLPEGKMLSIAAYPPPTIWHKFKEVHWEESYYRQISRQVHQMVVMMYDTAITNPKLYQSLIASWTNEVLSWTEYSKVLLGVPSYNDAGSGYHNPNVENLKNSIMGINAGLSNFDKTRLNSFTKTPEDYEGIAIYCEWEMDKDKWEYFSKYFCGQVNPKTDGNRIIEKDLLEYKYVTFIQTISPEGKNDRRIYYIKNKTKMQEIINWLKEYHPGNSFLDERAEDKNRNLRMPYSRVTFTNTLPENDNLSDRSEQTTYYIYLHFATSEKTYFTIEQLAPLYMIFEKQGIPLKSESDRDKNNTYKPIMSDRNKQISLMADEIINNKDIIVIRNMKHRWELAPFVGKNIQLYGRMIFYPKYKSEESRFAINGDLNLSIAGGCNIKWAEKMGLTFTKDCDSLISEYCIINAKLTFTYLDESIPESYLFLNSWCLGIGSGGKLGLSSPGLIKLFALPPKNSERPDSVSLAPYKQSDENDSKFLFSGMEKDADWVSFAHYVSILEKQKNAAIQVDNSKTIHNKVNNNNQADIPSKHELFRVEYMADLIPFTGTSVELKGKIIKAEKFGIKYWIVLNDDQKIAVPFHAGSDEISNEGKIGIIEGYLVFRYLNPQNNVSKFPADGHLFLQCSKFVRLLSPEEIQQNTIPCVRQIPDIMLARKKAFITGYYWDADARSLKNYIVNLLEYEMKDKK